MKTHALVCCLATLFTLASCSSAPKPSVQYDDLEQAEFDEVMETLKPKIIDCWGKFEPNDHIFAFRELKLDGYVQKTGFYKYVDLVTIPSSTKATQSCIERVIIDAQFPKRDNPTLMTYRMNFSI